MAMPQWAIAQSGSSCSNLAERPLRLEVPEPVQLADALIEELLSERIFGRDRKMHAAGGRGRTGRAHQIGSLPRPFVKRFAVHRVAGQYRG